MYGVFVYWIVLVDCFNFITGGSAGGSAPPATGLEWGGGGVGVPPPRDGFGVGWSGVGWSGVGWSGVGWSGVGVEWVGSLFTFIEGLSHFSFRSV